MFFRFTISQFYELDFESALLSFQTVNKLILRSLRKMKKLRVRCHKLQNYVLHVVFAKVVCKYRASQNIIDHARTHKHYSEKSIKLAFAEHFKWQLVHSDFGPLLRLLFAICEQSKLVQNVSFLWPRYQWLRFWLTIADRLQWIYALATRKLAFWCYETMEWSIDCYWN